MKFHRCVTQEYAKRGPAFDLDGETDESGVFPELVNKATGLGIEIRHLKVAARQGDLSSSSSRRWTSWLQCIMFNRTQSFESQIVYDPQEWQ